LEFSCGLKTLNPALPREDAMNVGSTYPLHIAAQAARMRPRELRRQVNNGFLKLQGCDRASTGSGDHAGYSLRRLLKAATMKSLTSLVSQSQQLRTLLRNSATKAMLAERLANYSSMEKQFY
jgi:hypothetical protein